MIKLNYLTILAALAAPLVANAADPRSLPLVACLNEEAVSKSVTFDAFYAGNRDPDHDDLRADAVRFESEEPDKTVDSACADAKEQVKFGELTIDAAEGTTGRFWLFPISEGEDGSWEDVGVQQDCTITIKDWPSVKTPTLYFKDYTKVFPHDADFEADGDGEGLFDIKCKEVKSGDEAAGLLTMTYAAPQSTAA